VSKISGPGGPPKLPPGTDNSQTPTVRDPKKSQTTGTQDGFEQRAKVGSQIAAQGPQLQTSSGRIQFSNADFAYLASVFAQIVNQDSTLERSKRAKLFSKEILKNKRLRKLLGKLKDAEIDKIADEIGEILSDSPYFGELIEEVTKGAQKWGAGG
jgi:hypothetical protein